LTAIFNPRFENKRALRSAAKIEQVEFQGGRAENKKASLLQDWPKKMSIAASFLLQPIFLSADNIKNNPAEQKSKPFL
jgi:hypothetical protein